MSNYNVGNIFGFSCTKCEYNRNCYGGNLGNQFIFCQKSKEKLESFDKLQQENKKYKEVIDKAVEFINREIEIIKEQPSKNKEIDEYVLRRYQCLLEDLSEV